MMPPQAEANLALEYSTDTRKLEWQATWLLAPRPLALSLQPVWAAPWSLKEL